MNELKDKFEISRVADTVVLTRNVFIDELAKPATRFLAGHSKPGEVFETIQRLTLVQLCPKHAVEMLAFTPGALTEDIATKDSFVCMGFHCVKRKDGVPSTSIIINLHDTDQSPS